MPATPAGPDAVIYDRTAGLAWTLDASQADRSNGHKQTVTTFGPNWFSRRQDINTDQLDAVFSGGDMWVRANQTTDPEERWRAWLTTYRAALGRAGFEYRLDFQIVPHSGQPL